MQKKIFSAFVLPASVLAIASSAQAADGVSEFARYNNVDWLLGGVAQLRDYPNNPGDPARQISLNNSAAVSGQSIQAAYLYWGGPSDLAQHSSNPTISFQGTGLVGAGLGVSFPNFGGYESYHAYRANVTHLLSGGFGANATFDVFNLWNLGGEEVNLSGASLMIIYNDGNASNNRDLVLFDGNDSNGSEEDGFAWHAQLSNINYTGGQANLYLGVADGDTVYEDGQLLLNGQHLSPNEFNGTILGQPTPGDDGFWDIAGYDISSILTANPSQFMLETSLYWDYTSLVHGFVDLPAAEQPVPEPATVISGGVLAALAASRLLRRRK